MRFLTTSDWGVVALKFARAILSLRGYGRGVVIVSERVPLKRSPLVSYKGVRAISGPLSLDARERLIGVLSKFELSYR